MKRHYTTFLILLLGFIFSGCNLPQENSAQTPTNTQTSDTPFPTATSAPLLAATVNGEDILLSTYQTSLTQLEIALEENPELLTEDETAQSKVLLVLTDRQILSQAARAAEFVVSDEIAAEHLNKIIEQIGGNQAFADWLMANGYSDIADFQLDINLEIEAAWQRDQITAGVPETAEQIEAHQVLFYSEFLALRAYDQLQNGASFDTIAANNDPTNLGYLGWFPRGYLLLPEVEEAAFALQPSQHTHVITTEIGFIILQILDRDPNHALSPDALQVLQSQAIRDWLETQRGQSQIEIYLP